MRVLIGRPQANGVSAVWWINPRGVSVVRWELCFWRVSIARRVLLKWRVSTYSAPQDLWPHIFEIIVTCRRLYGHSIFVTFIFTSAFGVSRDCDQCSRSPRPLSTMCPCVNSTVLTQTAIGCFHKKYRRFLQSFVNTSPVLFLFTVALACTTTYKTQWDVRIQ